MCELGPGHPGRPWPPEGLPWLWSETRSLGFVLNVHFTSLRNRVCLARPGAALTLCHPCWGPGARPLQASAFTPIARQPPHPAAERRGPGQQRAWRPCWFPPAVAAKPRGEDAGGSPPSTRRAGSGTNGQRDPVPAPRCAARRICGAGTSCPHRPQRSRAGVESGLEGEASK